MKIYREALSTLLIGLTLLLPFSFVRSAEKPKKTETQASAPQQAPRNPVKMIWEYKEELGLSDSQATDMKGAFDSFQKESLRLRSKLQVSELDFQDLLEKKADIDTIKQKLTEIADLQVQMELANIETARKIDGVLTDDQTNKWKEIQKKEASRPQPQTAVSKP